MIQDQIQNTFKSGKELRAHFNAMSLTGNQLIKDAAKKGLLAYQSFEKQKNTYDLHVCKLRALDEEIKNCLLFGQKQKKRQFLLTKQASLKLQLKNLQQNILENTTLKDFFWHVNTKLPDNINMNMTEYVGVNYSNEDSKKMAVNQELINFSEEEFQKIKNQIIEYNQFLQSLEENYKEIQNFNSDTEQKHYNVLNNNEADLNPEMQVENQDIIQNQQILFQEKIDINLVIFVEKNMKETQTEKQEQILIEKITNELQPANAQIYRFQIENNPKIKGYEVIQHQEIEKKGWFYINILSYKIKDFLEQFTTQKQSNFQQTVVLYIASQKEYSIHTIRYINALKSIKDQYSNMIIFSVGLNQTSKWHLEAINKLNYSGKYSGQNNYIPENLDDCIIIAQKNKVKYINEAFDTVIKNIQDFQNQIYSNKCRAYKQKISDEKYRQIYQLMKIKILNEQKTAESSLGRQKQQNIKLIQDHIQNTQEQNKQKYSQSYQEERSQYIDKIQNLEILASEKQNTIKLLKAQNKELSVRINILAQVKDTTQINTHKDLQNSQTLNDKTSAVKEYQEMMITWAKSLEKGQDKLRADLQFLEALNDITMNLLKDEKDTEAVAQINSTIMMLPK